MDIRNYILAILSAPLSDPTLTRVLAQRDSKNRVFDFKDWLLKVRQIHPTFHYDLAETSHKNWIFLEIKSPQSGTIGIRFIEQEELITADSKLPYHLVAEGSDSEFDLTLFALCADETQEAIKIKVNEFWEHS